MRCSALGRQSTRGCRPSAVWTSFEPGQGPNAGTPRPLAGLFHALRLLVKAEADVPGVLLVLAADEVARLLEEAQHAAVVGHHQGGEAFDAVHHRNADQVLEKEGAQAPALPLVLHREGALGQVRARITLVAGDGDDLLALLLPRH